uniref:Galectin n=1 Tax=Nomascus leucogenys TaxID=61853 RepID=A0A2I3H8S7_NOMLE
MSFLTVPYKLPVSLSVGSCVIIKGTPIDSSHYVPFEDGKPFDLRIYVCHNEYEVKVNGEYIYAFVHRIPPSYVKMIQVWRDVSLDSVLVNNGRR